jgi:hypothetical protein
MESYYDGIPPEIKKMSLKEIEARIAEIKQQEETKKKEKDNNP